mmetsp:Transcript_55930/g.126385  ORF Transcript_55930/g.126385 Transcript_55930/m.126385 type:complete len:92 (-) Transcript_55930:41-316(-)
MGHGEQCPGGREGSVRRSSCYEVDRGRVESLCAWTHYSVAGQCFVTARKPMTHWCLGYADGLHHEARVCFVVSVTAPGKFSMFVRCPVLEA